MNNLIGLILDKANLQLPGRVKFDIVVKGECELTREKAKHTLTLIEADLIEAELLAPIKAENARLTSYADSLHMNLYDRLRELTDKDGEIDELQQKNARLTAQVAAGKKLRDIIVAIVGNTPRALLPEPELEAAIAAFDAATAPADAEQARVKAGVREVRRGKPHISPEDARRLTSNDDDDPETQERIDALVEWADASYERMNIHQQRYERHEKAIDELWRAVKDAPNRQEITSLDKLLAKRLDLLNEAGGAYVTALHATNRRLDELAARVDGHDFMFRNLDVEVGRIGTALEAARQQTPQPTPSAPVTVTDAVVDAFCAVYFPTWKDAGPNNTTWIKGEVRPALEAAFAARDAEEGQGDDPHTGRR